MHVVRLTLPIALLASSVSSAQLPTDSLLRQTPRGYAVAVIDSMDPWLATAPTLANAIQARLPGVSVSQGEGFLGSSARIWLRGPSSFLVNEPLLVIDGARTHAADPNRVFINRALPSRLEDIDMETVERVEVLRGPAASAIYGPGASKGVILVTTKRARPGPMRWSAFGESGPLLETTPFPANFGTSGVSTASGAPVDNCPLAQQAARSCTAVARRSWNPLESAGPFRTGWRNSGGFAVSGDVSLFAYSLAANQDQTDGVYESDRSRATNGHVSVTVAPTPTVDVQFTGGHRIDRLRHPARSWIAAGLLGQSVDDPVRRGYSGSGYPDLARLARDEDVRRTTAALNARWRPLPSLRASAVVGYDRLGVNDDLTQRELQLGSLSDSTTIINRTLDRPETRTAAVAATASYVVRGLMARTTVGAEYIRDDDRGRSYDATIPDGAGGPSSVAQASLDLRRSSTGVYVQQHLARGDRLFLTGSLRVDRPTTFGLHLDNAIAESIDISWQGIDSSSAAASTWLGDLRLRAAYGRGGDHIVPTARFQQLGDPPRPPTETAEQGAELEVGIDASLLANRVRAQVTYYRATTDRGFELVPTTSGPVMTNSASVRTSGVEAALDARLLTTSGFGWDAGAILSVPRNEIRRMGGPPFVNSTNQLFRPGSSIGEYFEAPYSFIDADGDGRIAPSEVLILDDGYGPVGSPYPRYEAALHTQLTMFGGRVHISAVLDHRAGAKLYNEPSRFRCRTSCEEQHDPATSLRDQSRSVAALRGSDIGYIEDADYTKLREVRLALMVPSRVARLGFARSARLSITGRNLYTWTSFRGLDPEIISTRADAIVASDNFYQPALRSFVMRLDLVR